MVASDIAEEDSNLRSALKAEFFGPPRRSWRAPFSVIAFGLLLLASLVIPSLTAVEAIPESSLTMVGLMVMLGFAELTDPRHHRFIIALRFGGAATALLGFILRLF